VCGGEGKRFVVAPEWRRWEGGGILKWPRVAMAFTITGCAARLDPNFVVRAFRPRELFVYGLRAVFIPLVRSPGLSRPDRSLELTRSSAAWMREADSPL
jgi:hypothetical protein